MTSSLSPCHARGQVLKQICYSCNGDGKNWKSPIFSVLVMGTQFTNRAGDGGVAHITFVF